MSRLVAALAFLVFAAAPSSQMIGARHAYAASGDSECGEISWPVGRDRDAFANKDLPQRSRAHGSGA